MTTYTEEYTDSAASNLIAGDMKRVTDEVVIAAGQGLLKQGSVLGYANTDKYFLSQAAAADGSNIPSVILAADVDTTDGDKSAPVYKTGQFNRDALTLGAGHTLDSIQPVLRGVGIHLKKIV